MDIILVGKKLPNRTKIADIEVTASHLELPKLIFWLSCFYKCSFALKEIDL